MATDFLTGPGTELRVLRPDDFDPWYDTLIRAFGGVPESAEERELWNALTEFDLRWRSGRATRAWVRPGRSRSG
ncbi:hypothetical protein SSP24_79890 [Streptomyces spinoverrucosus]|uniref:N-acetyltransferase domain-containing protein n=1 Tax=Streptomyces spinoverrucosus TaxID=284043 RepID=A0A4Y3VTM1_9ACTN|nr:hypothetical protein SSP24_79890 [Streptomyces spinoverrucosus]GHB91126.1 hypothetical protein GCM10010397_74340 [Streptomyces spinoverrucosus]